jgi:hypothetical protein
MSISDLASIILAVSATVSLLYIARQVSVTRQQTKGQFLLALDEQFAKSRPILQRFVGEPNFRPEGQEWPKVWALMSVFERINIMVEDKILDIGIIDRLHGFVLLGIIANNEVYERLLATGAEWQDFIDLCRAIAKHRRRKGAGPHHAAFLERVEALDKETRLLKDPWQY